MNSFWGNLYDRYKDRRYAALFLATLVALALSPILLPMLGLYGLTRGLSALRLARANRQNQLRHPPLSRDELTKARSKLLKDRNFIRYERGLHFGSGGDCGMAGLQRGSSGSGDVARLSGRSRSRQ